MQLHEIRESHKSKKRIARGGKRGTTAGRGQKGQKSRSGHRIRPASRDLIIRIPKRRGYKNKPKSAKPLIVNINDLERVLQPLAAKGKPLVITPELLRERGVIPTSYYGNVKILGMGSLSFPAVAKGVATSKRAAHVLGVREDNSAKQA